MKSKSIDNNMKYIKYLMLLKKKKKTIEICRSVTAFLSQVDFHPAFLFYDNRKICRKIVKCN